MFVENSGKMSNFFEPDLKNTISVLKHLKFINHLKTIITKHKVEFIFLKNTD